MSYDEDIRTLVVLEKARLVAVIVAIAAVVLAVAFESKIFVAARLGVVPSSISKGQSLDLVSFAARLSQPFVSG